MGSTGGGTIWEKWAKTAWKLKNRHFWVKTVWGGGGGEMGRQANFSGSGGDPPVPPTMGNPALKLFSFSKMN